MLERIGGLVTIRNDQNQGFIGSCNRGAAAARGDLLVFLNNDTVVTSGWLEALAATFHEIPGTGLVGAKPGSIPTAGFKRLGARSGATAAAGTTARMKTRTTPSTTSRARSITAPGACVMVPPRPVRAVRRFRRALAPHITRTPIWPSRFVRPGTRCLPAARHDRASRGIDLGPEPVIGCQGPSGYQSVQVPRPLADRLAPPSHPLSGSLPDRPSPRPGSMILAGRFW